MPSFKKSSRVITDKVVLKYADNGELVIAEGYTFDYFQKSWELVWYALQEDPESETNVRSIDFPGPVHEEVEEWLKT
jgi:hypothetical protein